MAIQQHTQQPQKPERRKGFPLGQIIIIIIFILTIIAFCIAAYLILRNQGITQGSTTLTIVSIIFGLIVGLLALMFAIFQWRYPITPNTPKSSVTSSPPAIPSTSYHGIIGLPPPTDPRSIQQHEKDVKAVHNQLTQPGDAVPGDAEDSEPIVVEPSLPSKPAPHLTPLSLYNLGFQGRAINGVEVILPPLCLVPGGIFWMGSNNQQDPGAFDNEIQQHGIEVATFYIGKYPVTVAEYSCAVKAHAVSEPPDSKWKRLQRPDHPVLSVSWQDMVAYAAWLAKVTGQPWRLPTEAEWEKAARGSDDRIYPWGNKWDPENANTGERGPGATTPVGSYPQGASPYGALDMAGNVFEWTSSIYKPYPYRMDDGREDMNDMSSERVLRGGSWDSTHLNVCAACRYCNPIDKRDCIVGGRLVLDGAGSS